MMNDNILDKIIELAFKSLQKHDHLYDRQCEGEVAYFATKLNYHFLYDDLIKTAQLVKTKVLESKKPIESTEVK